MRLLKVLFLFPLFLVIYATTNGCPSPTSGCGNRSLIIQFPFRVEGQQPRNCGYPGFDLSCNSQGITVLNLPYSGEFFVRSINYRAQEIQLYDPNNCLPRRLLDFNLSEAPFVAPYHVNYTFLSCPAELTMSRFTVIDCLSNSTNTTLATSSIRLATEMTMCRIIATLPIPVPLPSRQEDGFSSVLDCDLWLTWDVPNCEDCAAQGAVCGFKNRTIQEVACFSTPDTSKPRGLRVFQTVSIALAIPAITCAFGIAFFACFVRGNQDHRAAVTPQPATALVAGLDESTIESYTKVVLGESRRVPGPYHGTCAICLSDYRAEEMVRVIPDCSHCFHADCIDEWLRKNASCPVCRNSPSLAHVNV
ncbi:putative RING-H2 finger protein ATL21A [Diospyros lotus]|uniref:putative RING-H2 finger protein ATL21A n=1 Tax=Diospyros lotus TaxID=55363 RepID=UPI002251469F|nr:putative RING-H2 finger protein ATL21A [Diospyros lotus]